jgi:hypothetical protein
MRLAPAPPGGQIAGNLSNREKSLQRGDPRRGCCGGKGKSPFVEVALPFATRRLRDRRDSSHDSLWRRLAFVDGSGGVTRWETSERVLESGGFESRERVLVAEPVVEASEAGARTLGVTYWRAVDCFTRGGVRATWTGGGGRLKLLGGATLLTFGPPELSFDGGIVRCRHAIQGGLLALRTGGCVTLAQRREGAQQELSVTVEGYLPRLAARAGAPQWSGMLYAKVQSPLHVGVSRRYFELLLRGRGS